MAQVKSSSARCCDSFVQIVEKKGTGKLVANAEPRPKPTLTLTLVSIPPLEGIWIDVEPGILSQKLFLECQQL